MFAIAGASGHTGSVVASTLLAKGRPVRVIVRDEKKGAPWQDKGAEVAVARLDDAAALTAALRGVAGVYALVPPVFPADDPLALQARVIDSWVAALTATRPRHVLLLSSVGSELERGTGPIISNHRAEEKLRATGVPLTVLRAAYFMENWNDAVEPVRSEGVLPSMITPGHRLAMVATADIGRVAAEALAVGERAAPLIELAGPRDYTPEDVAAAFGRALGRTVAVAAVPDEAAEPALERTGLAPKAAALFHEMNNAFSDGTIDWLGRPARGRVGIDDFVRGLVA